MLGLLLDTRLSSSAQQQQREGQGTCLSAAEQEAVQEVLSSAIMCMFDGYDMGDASEDEDEDVNLTNFWSVSDEQSSGIRATSCFRLRCSWETPLLRTVQTLRRPKNSEAAHIRMKRPAI